jgi:tetratricopeptide (TPR) repeat protein
MRAAALHKLAHTLDPERDFSGMLRLSDQALGLIEGSDARVSVLLTLEVVQNKAACLANLGRYEEAIAFAQPFVERYRKSSEIRHVLALAGIIKDQGHSFCNLRRVMDALSKYDESIGHLERLKSQSLEVLNLHYSLLLEKSLLQRKSSSSTELETLDTLIELHKNAPAGPLPRAVAMAFVEKASGFIKKVVTQKLLLQPIGCWRL